jgi:MFS transporter, FHS family, glucose/mannose:H+ symporter
MFLPQVILAILGSGAAPALARRWTLRRVFVLGMAGDLASMVLLALSWPAVSTPGLAYGLLLLATGALGLGFGASVMALNTLAEEFFPAAADSAVLAMNVLLGTGTALAPLLVAAFSGLGAWWMLPVVVALVLLVVLLLTLRASLHAAVPAGGRRTAEGGTPSRPGRRRGLPGRFWLYAAAALLYGIVETVNGNWSVLYLMQQRGVAASWASLALTAFWAMVTVGRLLASLAPARVPARWIYLGLSALTPFTVLIVSAAHTAAAGVVAFGLAGLACSPFLPLTISFGGEEFSSLKAVMSGELIAFYQVGYGLAAFGVGPLEDAAGIPLSAVYALASVVAAATAVLALLIVRPRAGADPRR